MRGQPAEAARVAAEYGSGFQFPPSLRLAGASAAGADGLFAVRIKGFRDWTGNPGPNAVSIPTATKLAVRLMDKLSTNTNKVGDRFRVTLDPPLAVEGVVVAAKGADLEGRITNLMKRLGPRSARWRAAGKGLRSGLDPAVGYGRRRPVDPR